ncbi:MAG TPA: hypothetical protein VGY50_12080 [Streptosporangiaceae bacterium]|jgi:hypothetical protein|nr:hypothetical protein [Streptosporangiaceae bacterium]
MSAVVWANIVLAIPFLAVFIGIPLWMTFKRPQTGPDHTEANAYLRTRTAFAAAMNRRAARRAVAGQQTRNAA